MMNFVPAMCSGKDKDKLVPFVTHQSGDQEKWFVRLAVAAGVARNTTGGDIFSMFFV